MILRWWIKPRGVAIKMNNGRVIPCRVVRERGEDRDRFRAWRVIPKEPYDNDCPLWVTADFMPGRTIITMPLELE